MSAIHWAVQELAKSLNADESLIRELVDILSEKNLLIKTADGPAYVPARDIEQITVKDVLDSIRTFGELERKSALEKRWGNSIGDLMKNVDFAVAETLKGQNLQMLIQNLNVPDPRIAEAVTGSSRR